MWISQSELGMAEHLRPNHVQISAIECCCNWYNLTDFERDDMRILEHASGDEVLASQPASGGSTCSTVPYPRWELSTIPPRPTIYSDQVGMEPDLPLTRPPVHNPPDCFHSVSVLHTTSLISYATLLRLYVHRILNRVTASYYTYSSVTPYSHIQSNQIQSNGPPIQQDHWTILLGTTGISPSTGDSSSDSSTL
jgi:hypothetical protein